MGVMMKSDGARLPATFRHVSSLPGGDVLQRFNGLVARQRKLSQPQLCEWQARLLGPKGSLENFSRRVSREGSRAPGLDYLAVPGGARHRLLAEKCANFVLSLYRRHKVTVNPFNEMPRTLLCCVIFDHSAPYTLAERFAAMQALRQQDSAFFIKLIATTHHTVERRLVFIGLLEHFDALLPIEQSIYPRDYRTVQQGHLNREQALYGALTLDKPLSKLFEAHTPQWLVENLATLAWTDDATGGAV